MILHFKEKFGCWLHVELVHEPLIIFKFKFGALAELEFRKAIKL